MTDDRPRPRYGEYAPPGAVVPQAPSTPIVESAPIEKVQDAEPTPRRTWDVALTTALILVGVIDVVSSFSRYGNLAAFLREVYNQQGLGKFTSDTLANDMGIAMNVTRVVLLVAAIGFGLWRLGRHKIAFWVPLLAGVIAFIVICVCLLVVVLNDPALAEYAMRQSTAP